MNLKKEQVKEKDKKEISKEYYKILMTKSRMI